MRYDDGMLSTPVATILIGLAFMAIAFIFIGAFIFMAVVYLLPIAIFIFVCYELALHCNNAFIGFLIVIAMLAGGGLYYHKVLQVETGTHPASVRYNKQIDNILNNTYDNVNNVASSGNNQMLSQNFINGTNNKSYHKLDNWAMHTYNTIGQQRVNGQKKYVINIYFDKNGSSINTNGNTAYAKYNVSYSIGKKFYELSWHTHLQKYNGKWLIKNSTTDNEKFNAN